MTRCVWRFGCTLLAEMMHTTVWPLAGGTIRLAGYRQLYSSQSALVCRPSSPVRAKMSDGIVEKLFLGRAPDCRHRDLFRWIGACQPCCVMVMWRSLAFSPKRSALALVGSFKYRNSSWGTIVWSRYGSPLPLMYFLLSRRIYLDPYQDAYTSGEL